MLPNDSDVNKLWPKLKEKMGEFFEGLDIKPSLLHGDLWSGNAGQVGSTPVIYDASSFYGHHEYDLAIAGKYFIKKLSKLLILLGYLYINQVISLSKCCESMLTNLVLRIAKKVL